MAPLRSSARIIAACALGLAAWSVGADDVTIYRCTDAAGRLTLRDTPCTKGQTQQARSMIRPKDAPAVPKPRASDERTSMDRANDDHREPPRYVMVNPIRQMYECEGPDGELYVNDTGVGRSRFEPVWYPVIPVVAHPHAAFNGVFGRADFHGGNVNGSVSIGEVPRPHPHPQRQIVPVISTGDWVRDPCYALPQAEVCDRMRDERQELNRRWNIAQPTERAQIDLQTRGLDARLDSDCGGR